MPRSLLASLVLCCALAAASQTSAQPSGLLLRWTHCAADGGIVNRVFACNTNAGSERIVCSYQTNAPIVDASGAEITVDLRADATTLPIWWQFKQSGTCRLNSFSMNLAADPLWVNCADQWNGQASGGIGAYHIGLLAPNMSRIRAAAAVPQGALFTVLPGTEYFVVNFLVNHTKTVGTGSCAGCTTPMCILFAGLLITTPVAANNRLFNTPLDGNHDHWVGWQGGVAQNPRLACDPNVCNYEFGCSVSPVPTRHSTWGAVKSLFR